MNKFIRMGRLCADPEIRYTAGENATCIANFRIAVDRRFKRNSDPNASTADFFNLVAFGKQAEFVEKYLKKGIKILVTGRTENNNYTNKEGKLVYSNQDIAEEIEFAESKNASNANGVPSPQEADASGFNNIPDELSDDSLPFK